MKTHPLRRCYTLLLVFILSAISTALGAQTSKSPSESSTFSILFENDLFGDTDQQYTNGVQVSWEVPDLTRYADAERLPAWLLPIVAHLPWINEPDTQRNVGFSIGQKIFTPNNTQSSDLVADDRPYAGWLCGGLSFTSKTHQRMDRFEFQFGVIGPAAQGEEAQNFVHDLRDLPKTRGWSHQLKNEPGLALIYERKWRPLTSSNENGIGYDIITHAGGAIGNVFVYANAPTTVNDPRLANTQAYGCYVFAAVTSRLVGRDIFLDGNTFTDNHEVDKEIVVGDLIVGGSVVFRRYKLSYAQVFRSREFEGQRDKPNFGSVSLSITF